MLFLDLGVKLPEELARRLAFSFSRLLQSLANAFAGIGRRRDVEQSLVGPGVLDYSSGLALHREDHGALALAQLFEEVCRTAAKRGQRLDVLGQVDVEIAHDLPSSSTFLGAHRIPCRFDSC